MFTSPLAISLSTLQATATTTEPKDHRNVRSEDEVLKSPFNKIKDPKVAWGFDINKARELQKERLPLPIYNYIVQYSDTKKKIEQLNKEKAGYVNSIVRGEELLKQQLDHNSGSNDAKKNEFKKNNKTAEDITKAKIVETDKKIAEHQALLHSFAVKIMELSSLTAEQVSKIPSH